MAKLGFEPKEQIEELFVAASAHMMGFDVLVKRYGGTFTLERSEQFLAFEFGVLEWYDQTLLRPNRKPGDGSGMTFLEFVHFYAKNKYRDRAPEAMEYFAKYGMSTTLRYRERELGFRSVDLGISPDGSRKEGHLGLEQFVEALRLPEYVPLETLTVSGPYVRHFPQISAVAFSHMDMLFTLYQHELTSPTEEQVERLFAFELGVLEWHDGAMLRFSRTAGDDGAKMFLDFLQFYSLEKYKQGAPDILRRWHGMMSGQGSMLKERELGFRSLNDGLLPDGTRKPNWFGIKQFQQALGLLPPP